MQKEIEITLPPEELHNEAFIFTKVAQALQLPKDRICSVKPLKRSIDARSKHVVYRLRVVAFIDEVPEVAPALRRPNKVNHQKTIIIVGAGPAGLFDA